MNNHPVISKLEIYWITAIVLVLELLSWLNRKRKKAGQAIVRNYYLAFHKRRCIELLFFIGNSQQFLRTGKIQYKEVCQSFIGQKLLYLGKNIFLLLDNHKLLKRNEFLRQYPLTPDEVFKPDEVNNQKHGI